MDSRKDFLTIVLPTIEETVISSDPSKQRREKRTGIIEEFFRRMGCNAQAPPIPESLNFLNNIRFRMTNPNFSEYLKLVNYNIPPKDIIKFIHNTVSFPDRKAKALPPNNIRCAKYLEDVLFDLLEKAQTSADIDKYVNLLMCPVKVYFQLFIEFTINPRISSAYAIEYSINFMSLTSAIINKKMEQMERGMDLSMLQEIPGIVIILLASRHIMCNEWLNKIDRELSFRGSDLYDNLRTYFDVTQSLYRRYLAFIENKIREVKEIIDTSRKNVDDLTALRGRRELSPEQIEYDIQMNLKVIGIQQDILSNLTRMNDELSHLALIIRNSVRLNGKFSSIGEAVTPARPARPGGSKHKHKQVKSKSSKTKKYKKKFSKTKKYKKKYKIY
jgi:hypothetical protein